jgi:hypothetical protein
MDKELNDILDKIEKNEQIDKKKYSDKVVMLINLIGKEFDNIHNDTKDRITTLNDMYESLTYYFSYNTEWKSIALKNCDWIHNKIFVESFNQMLIYDLCKYIYKYFNNEEDYESISKFIEYYVSNKLYSKF